MSVEKKSEISKDELNKSLDIINKIQKYCDEKIVGQEKLKKSLLVSVIANGHILLESVPGLAKTTAAKTLTEAVSGKFSRIQCTPDLLPSDIIGTQIFNYKTNEFETKIGPIYSNFILLDEINRASSKTQSAMLEAMQEHGVSIGGKLYKMPEPFIVIATQNPIEQEGTYLLPEAQLDRFLLKEKLEYPNIQEEMQIINKIEKEVFNNSSSVVSIKDILFLQDISKKVYIDESIKRYIVNIIYASRHPFKLISKELAQLVVLGSSPRGTISLMQVSKAVALINGRDYVVPEDVRELVHSVLRHRISLSYSAIVDNITSDDIIDAIIGGLNTP